MTAVGLLREMESTAPKMLYIQWQLDRAPKDELRDNALESLAAMGKGSVAANAAGVAPRQSIRISICWTC